MRASAPVCVPHITHHRRASTVEHSMSIAAGVYRGSLCTRVSAIEGYFSVAFPQLYDVLHWLRDDRPHTEASVAMRPVETADVVTLLVVELINYYCTILWTFMDIFIVAISMCLTLRFRQLNEHLERHRDRVGVKLLYGFCIVCVCVPYVTGDAATFLGLAARALQ